MSKKSLESARIQSKQWHDAIRKKVLTDPVAQEVYERMRQEIELALILRKAREKADISQETIAKRMQTTRTAISRFEASGLNQRHSPSIQTLLKYVHALGYTLKFTLIPTKVRSRKKVV